MRIPWWGIIKEALFYFLNDEDDILALCLKETSSLRIP